MTSQHSIAELAVLGCSRTPKAKTPEQCSKCEFRKVMCNAYAHAEKILKYLNKVNSPLVKDNSVYKPPVGKQVFLIYRDSILVEQVGYAGKNSFIIEGFSDLLNFDSLEWYYEDYGKTWFTDLQSAKDELIRIFEERDLFKRKYRVVKIDATSYEVQDE